MFVGFKTLEICCFICLTFFLMAERASFCVSWTQGKNSGLRSSIWSGPTCSNCSLAMRASFQSLFLQTQHTDRDVGKGRFLFEFSSQIVFENVPDQIFQLFSEGLAFKVFCREVWESILDNFTVTICDTVGLWGQSWLVERISKCDACLHFTTRQWCSILMRNWDFGSFRVSKKERDIGWPCSPPLGLSTRTESKSLAEANVEPGSTVFVVISPVLRLHFSLWNSPGFLRSQYKQSFFRSVESAWWDKPDWLAMWLAGYLASCVVYNWFFMLLGVLKASRMPWFSCLLGVLHVFGLSLTVYLEQEGRKTTNKQSVPDNPRKRSGKRTKQEANKNETINKNKTCKKTLGVYSRV